MRDSLLLPNTFQIACPREEVVPILVERNRHHSVGGQERFFHSVTMMDVDVHIQHPLLVLQQLENGQHDVVNITETRRLHTQCAAVRLAPGRGDYSVLVWGLWVFAWVMVTVGVCMGDCGCGGVCMSGVCIGVTVGVCRGVRVCECVRGWLCLCDCVRVFVSISV